MVPALPWRSSCFRSTRMTSGRGFWLKRFFRQNRDICPDLAWCMVSNDGVAEPSTSRALCWTQRYLATSRAW